MGMLDKLRKTLIDSALLTAEAIESQLDSWRGQTGVADDVAAESFIDWLIDKGHLSEFQGDAIIEGHSALMLGPYRVHEQLKTGNLGDVYRAVHEETGQPVSLKIFPSSLKDDPEKWARVGREARIFAELHHANVLNSFQIGSVGGVQFVALEDLHGETLAERLERDGKLPYEEACRIIRDVAKGLAHLHANDVVHRDLRPDNIWLTESGSAKIMEFGAAWDWFARADVTDEGDEVTNTESVIGQYEYTPPEQAEDPRNADARSDIYALGCTLYQCLAGTPPFTDKNPVKLVLKHARETPTPVSELDSHVPAAIDDTVSGMLEKEPAKRFQEAQQVVYALDQYVPHEAPAPEVVEVSDQYLEWVRSQQEPSGVSLDAPGIDPELAEFVGWLSRRKPRPRR